jgi:hypothetical protein
MSKFSPLTSGRSRWNSNTPLFKGRLFRNHDALGIERQHSQKKKIREKNREKDSQIKSTRQRRDKKQCRQIVKRRKRRSK